MELTVLGTSAGWPDAGRANAGYLVQHEGFTMALDLGTGTLANLQRWLPHERIDAVAISHRHPDHWLDLYPLSIARRFHPTELPPLPVFAPDGVMEGIEALSGSEDAGAAHRTFTFRRIEPGEAFQAGPFRVSTMLMPHLVPDLGMRITAAAVTLAYTGDTGPGPEVPELAEGVDLLLTEASWVDGQHDDTPGIHLTARQAGAAAAAAGVPQLVLTHLWPGNDRDRARAEAEDAFGAPVVVAEEHLRLPVG
ncbi:MAG: MBL fold metallo-hydrolase [Candidatus Velamenicoccus archaeovorus]